MTYILKYPIIEMRKSSFFVLNEFGGNIFENEIKIRHNLIENYVTFIVDSSGCVLELTYTNNNKNITRALVGYLWNISHDFYSYTVNCKRNIGWFRSVMSKYLNCENPDMSEMAHQFIAESEGYSHDTPLSAAIDSFNL